MRERAFTPFFFTSSLPSTFLCPPSKPRNHSNGLKRFSNRDREKDKREERRGFNEMMRGSVKGKDFERVE